jgi:hypothetical protein
MRLNIMTKTKLLVSALALVAVAAGPAWAAKVDRAKAEHNQVQRGGIERMSPMVVEPGDKALAPVGPAFVNRAYTDAVRANVDPQLNRGY